MPPVRVAKKTPTDVAAAARERDERHRRLEERQVAFAANQKKLADLQHRESLLKQQAEKAGQLNDKQQQQEYLAQILVIREQEADLVSKSSELENSIQNITAHITETENRIKELTQQLQREQQPGQHVQVLDNRLRYAGAASSVVSSVADPPNAPGSFMNASEMNATLEMCINEIGRLENIRRQNVQYGVDNAAVDNQLAMIKTRYYKYEHSVYENDRKRNGVRHPSITVKLLSDSDDSVSLFSVVDTPAAAARLVASPLASPLSRGSVPRVNSNPPFVSPRATATVVPATVVPNVRKHGRSDGDNDVNDGFALADDVGRVAKRPRVADPSDERFERIAHCAFIFTCLLTVMTVISPYVL